MGNLDRLLEALARQLPRSADHTSIAAALHEAAKALPESQAKTRKRLTGSEEACVVKIEALLKEKPEDAIEEVATDVQEDALVENPAGAGYADITDDDPTVCVARCAELLQAALGSLRPAKHAEEALEGLMAILSTSETALELEILRKCIEVLPTASAALGCSGSPALCHFSAFLITTFARIESSDGHSSAYRSLAVKLGSLVALTSDHSSARVVLHRSLKCCDEVAGNEVLACLSAAIMPIVYVAFGRLNAFKDVDMVRGDLAALLHTLRFIGLCRKAAVGEARSLTEANNLIVNALEHHFDAAALLPRLRGLVIVGAKRKRRGKGDNVEKRTRAESAKLVSEAVLKASTSMTAAAIAEIASASGLPMGNEEDADRLAAVARARGDLFFEDVAGTTAAVVNAKASIRLDGVEALNSGPSKKKRKMEACSEEE